MEALADNWSRILGAICSQGRIPHPLQGFHSSPRSYPDIVSDFQARSPRSLALRQEVEKMLSKDALEIVLDPGPGFYSSLFLVEKVTGGWRPVIDLSHLNEFVLQTLFKMETVASVLLSVRERDFLASIDLKDAYFQIPIHQSSRKLLRFLSGGRVQVYQFKALCFWLSTAPQVFTGCLQRYLCGHTPTGFVFSGTWTIDWSSPLWRRKPKRTSRICFRFVTPSG